MKSIALILAALASSSAQDGRSDADGALDAVIEAAEEAADAAMLAVDPTTGDEDLDEAKAKRIAEIDATMRLVASDPELGRTLPLPYYVLTAEIEAALAHRSAWRDGVGRSELITPYIGLADATGHAIYYEWACSTGKDAATAQTLIGRLERDFTDYPQRLLLKRAMESRDIMGYGDDRQCAATDLERSRRRLLEAQISVGASAEAGATFYE